MPATLADPRLAKLLIDLRQGTPDRPPSNEDWQAMVLRIYRRSGLYAITAEHFDQWLADAATFEDCSGVPFEYFGRTTVHGTFLLFFVATSGDFLVRHMTSAETDALCALADIPNPVGDQVDESAL